MMVDYKVVYDKAIQEKQQGFGSIDQRHIYIVDFANYYTSTYH
jgi:hypothetical protein